MILRINGLENDIEIQPDKVTHLQIRNKVLNRSIIKNIYEYSPKNTDEIVFLGNDEKQMKESEVLTLSVTDPEINSKKFLSALYSLGGKLLALDVESRHRININFHNVKMEILTLFNDFDFKMVYNEEVKIDDIFKIFNLRFENNPNFSYLDVLYCKIDIISELFEESLLVLPNLSVFFENVELKELIKYINYKKLHCLILDQDNLENIFDLRRFVVDEDLCEFAI